MFIHHALAQVINTPDTRGELNLSPDGDRTEWARVINSLEPPVRVASPAATLRTAGGSVDHNVADATADQTALPMGDVVLGVTVAGLKHFVSAVEEGLSKGMLTTDGASARVHVHEFVDKILAPEVMSAGVSESVSQPKFENASIAKMWCEVMNDKNDTDGAPLVAPATV